MNKADQNLENEQIVSCFRPDGSLDIAAALTSGQVMSGFLLIIAGLLASFLYSHFVHSGSDILDMVVMLLCSLLCFSGARTILDYINIQVEAKKKR